MKDLVEILFVDDDPAEEVILRSLMKRTTAFNIHMHYCSTLDSAVDFLSENLSVAMVLIDNRLYQGNDFRENVPALRQKGYIGPIGVISSSIDDPYFQKIEDFGVDFRIDKAEFDPTAIEFILREYLQPTSEASN